MEEPSITLHPSPWNGAARRARAISAADSPMPAVDSADEPTAAGREAGARGVMYQFNLVLPPVADMVAMNHSERMALLAQLDALAHDLAEARGALRALLHEPPVPAPLLDAKEAARRLGVSVDTVRAKGSEWDIEVYLADGLCRYDPAKVEALRQRRRPPPTDPIRGRLNTIA